MEHSTPAPRTGYRVKIVSWGGKLAEGSVSFIGRGPTFGRPGKVGGAPRRRAELPGEIGDGLTPQQVDELQRQETAVERSARRTRQTIRHRIFSIGADRLWTFTYRENVEDLDRVRRDWDRFRRKMEARFPSWQYVAVPERQQRGAWHIHAASRGYLPVGVVRRLWLEVVLDGNVDVSFRSKPGQGGSGGTASRVARYLSKYVSKTLDAREDIGARRYWSTRDIVLPPITRVWVEGASWSDAKAALLELMGQASRGPLRFFECSSFFSFWAGST